MAGIYIHIPFCKKACSYCDFHFSTSLKTKDEFLTALINEIEMRHDFLKDKYLQSIYFGGGTPSILSSEEIAKIFEVILIYFNIDQHTEITLEANPDDVTFDKFSDFKSLGINRLSLGIQSFFDTDLKYMNRAHDTKMALESLEILDKIGYKSVSADLIYGSPTTTDEMLKQNIGVLADCNIVNHISAYALTVESGTALKSLIDRGLNKNVDEEHQRRQSEIVQDELLNRGFDHYEISNFAKGENIAIHNTNYWFGKAYLGVGPSAHSYDGENRFFNVSNNVKYIKAIYKNELPITEDKLSDENRYNEYILTNLRTKWGISLPKIEKDFPIFIAGLRKNLQSVLKNNWVYEKDNSFVLTTEGKHYADRVAMELFV